MFNWFYDTPTIVAGALFVGAFVAATWFGIIFLRPIFMLWLRRQTGRNDLVGYCISSLAVFYGLLLGLIAMGAYQNFSTIDANVTHEGGSLAALYRVISYGMASPEREDLQEKLREYTRITIEEDWPQQQRGIVPTSGTERYGKFMESLIGFEPQNFRQDTIYAEALRQATTYTDLRRQRLSAISGGIPEEIWGVVLIGAALNIMLVWLFEMQFTVHIILGGILSAFLGTVIFVMVDMDHPFLGEVSVRPDAIKAVYDTLMKLK